MRRMLMIVGVVIPSLCFLAGTGSAVEYKWTDAGFVEVGPPAAPVTVKRAVVIPPGHHAHTRADGSTFIHGDENFGNPAAHTGVSRPWPKTGFPGQTVIVDEVVSNAPASILAADPCPGGVCPPRGRRTISNDVVTIYESSSSYYSSETSSSRGLLGRIVDNIRSRRAARGGGFFGCPCR